MQRKELTRRRIIKEIRRRMSINHKAAFWHEKREITKKFIGEIVGGCTTAVRLHMDNMKEELDEHHDTCGIEPGHNFKVQTYLRQQPTAEVDTLAVNLGELRKFEAYAQKLIHLLRDQASHFNTGDLVGLVLDANEHRVNLEATLELSGRDRVKVRSSKKRYSRKSTPLERQINRHTRITLIIERLDHEKL